MINMVCNKCGYRLPLSSKDKPTILSSTQSSSHRNTKYNNYNNDVVCPKCRRILAKGKQKIVIGVRKNDV